MKNKSAQKRRNINFRQTRSERSATNSYRNFGQYIKEKSINLKIQKSKIKTTT